jgi:hypothetical protein
MQKIYKKDKKYAILVIIKPPDIIE